MEVELLVPILAGFAVPALSATRMDTRRYPGSSPSLGQQASSAQEQSPAPQHVEPAGTSTQLPRRELALPTHPRAPAVGTHLSPPPLPQLTPPQPLPRPTHLLQTITPITMDTSTVSTAMTTTTMMRMGFCSLEATVTVGGKQGRLAAQPGAGPRRGAAPATPPSAGLPPPARLWDDSSTGPGYALPPSQQFTCSFVFKSSSWRGQMPGQRCGCGWSNPHHASPGSWFCSSALRKGSCLSEGHIKIYGLQIVSLHHINPIPSCFCKQEY